MGTDGTSQRGASARTRTGAGMHPAPRFLQGVFAFEGRGIDQPFPIGGAVSYTVSDGVTAQAVYFRGGAVVVDLGLLEV